MADDYEALPPDEIMDAIDPLELLQRLHRFGYARNRDVDREIRTVTITDDEARFLHMAVLENIENIKTIEDYEAEMN